jgi:hypothetical protein
MARAPSTLSLVFGTVILGILAGALLVKQTVKPIDTSRLVPVRDAQLGKAVGSGSVPQGRVMVASRRAVREIYAPVTFSGVVKRLFSKTPPPYNFREEVYESVQAKLSKKATLDESGAGSDAESEDPPEGDAGSEEPSEGWDEDWDIQEVHLWSDTPPGHDEEGDVELQDILTYNLAGFVFFMAVLLYMEVSACLRRRQRDFLLATAAWRGNDTAFKAQCAKESQIMLYRPFVSWGAAIGIWSVVKSGMDVYGKCFFNWDCFFNFDCHLRILIPAEFECTFDVMLPAAVVTGVMICGVLAAVWVFTRPWASLVLLGTFVTGVFAIWTVSLFACTLWLFCAVGFNYFYFAMLLYKHEAPAWCEDLGSLSFASNPRSGAIRDGDKAQHWHENPDGTKHPSRSELSQLLWFERVCYHIADFYHTHLRGLRVLWNGAVMRAVVLLIIGRRVRVFGEENVQHLGSHDKVLVASNHRTFFDFWIITVCGLWAKTGATLFSFYPVRSTWFYTHVAGLLMNMTFSSFAMFPPIMNTPSDKNKEENMRSKESAHKWNDYALRRVIADLKCPGVLCGMSWVQCVLGAQWSGGFKYEGVRSVCVGRCNGCGAVAYARGFPSRDVLLAHPADERGLRD